VTVNAPPPPPPPPPPSITEEELFAQNVKDIYFDYDKYDVRAADQGSLQGDVQFLQQHPNIHITIEGHCDERGSTEYNLALGTNRADAVKNALIQAGVGGDRIKTISYGKENRSAPSPTKAAGSKTAAATSYTRNKWRGWRDGRLARPAGRKRPALHRSAKH